MDKEQFTRLSTSEKLAFISSKLPKQKPTSPPQKKSITDKQKDLLKGLATRIIGEYSNETETEIIKQIQRITGVNEDRAKTGFKQMQSLKIVSNAIRDRYYLTDSLPY